MEREAHPVKVQQNTSTVWKHFGVREWHENDRLQTLLYTFNLSFFYQNILSLRTSQVWEGDDSDSCRNQKKPRHNPSTPTPTVASYSLTFKNDDARRFLKPDVTLVSEKGEIHDVSSWLQSTTWLLTARLLVRIWSRTGNRNFSCSFFLREHHGYWSPPNPVNLKHLTSFSAPLIHELNIKWNAQPSFNSVFYINFNM